VLNIIDAVPDGGEAMRYLRGEGPYEGKSLPGMILLDISMPRKNGFEVLEEVKADPKLKRIPVVMLTTSERDEDILRSYEAGACTYVRKPIGFHEMIEVAKQFSLYWTIVARLPE